MRTVGIFEAKTRFVALCEEVARTGQAALIRKRGVPLVVVGPVPATLATDREDILTAWKNWASAHSEDELQTEFPDVRSLRGPTKSDPFAEP